MAKTAYIAAPYRNTTLGGVTLPIAVRRANGMIAVVPPVSRYFSRSGTHGVFYFPADISAIIILDRTNTGHRSVYVRCFVPDATFCDMLRRCARDLWVARRMSPRDVIAALPSSCR